MSRAIKAKVEAIQTRKLYDDKTRVTAFVLSVNGKVLVLTPFEYKKLREAQGLFEIEEARKE